MCYEKGHTGQAQMSIESERLPGYFYSTDIFNYFLPLKAIHSNSTVELHLSEHAKNEPLDFFADIEHYQLRKRL